MYFFQDYLSHFGYLNKIEANSKIELEDAREAVREFQDFAHLNPNGRLNSRTLRTMNKPRCGNRDLRIFEGDEIDLDAGARSRRKRDDSPGKDFIIFIYYFNGNQEHVYNFFVISSEIR